MNTPLIKLLTMGHTLERARDRTGVYTLRYMNKFPKFRPVARVARVEPPPAGHCAPTAAQPSLFAAPKNPAVVEAESAPTGTAGTEGTKGTNPAGKTVQARPPAAPKVHIGWLATFSAFLAAGFAFVPKTAARIRDRLRSPSADSRPRAQAELALEKVTVLRNDLSDSDLVVVAVQRKPEDSRDAPAETRPPARNPWTRVAARWVTLKNPEDLAQTPP
jgi:hypothetical protein